MSYLFRKIGCTILIESCSNNISSLTDPESNGPNDVASLIGVTDPDETTELDGTVASNPSNIDDAPAYLSNNSDAGVQKGQQMPVHSNCKIELRVQWKMQLGN